jgi:rhodanese-related sulfurtransferase
MTGPGAGGVAQVDVAETERRVREAATTPGRPLIVDVRELGEIVGGRIEGARILPMSEFERRYRELPPDRPLLVVCASGYRSGLAAQFLSANGYPDAANVAGGMHAWERAGLPVKRGQLAPGEGGPAT